MYRFCLGELGMSYSQARQMSMWEFYTKVAHYRDKQRERAVEYQILAAIALNPHTKKPLSPSKLIRIPGQHSAEMSSDEKKADIEHKLRLYKHGKRIKC